MSRAGTHYEQAFEHYLQQKHLPYVAVDQSKKAIFSAERIKSFDFIVYPNNSRKILVDVKGRKFSYSSFQKGHFGESWVTKGDVEGLKCWQQVFGADYIAVFIFAYWLFDKTNPDHFYRTAIDLDGDTYYYQQRHYSFVAAMLREYRLQMRPRSTSWQTVYVPRRQFRTIAEPVDYFLGKNFPRQKPLNRTR